MPGFFTRLWIVFCWLGRLARRGELKPLLIRAVVMTVRDLHFLSQLTWARLLVRFKTWKRRARQESLKHEADNRRLLTILRRTAKKTPVDNKD